MSNNDWKKRLGVVYSTSDDFEYNEDDNQEETKLAPNQQKLTIQLDKRQRKGKKVTLISGFIGNEDDLKNLGKDLKSKCGTGGSVKNKDILIQGDFREKAKKILIDLGYKVKISGM